MQLCFFSHKTLLDSFSGCNGGWGCCTSSNPCGAAEGHCWYNEDCLGYLLCGTDNCYFLQDLPYLRCCYDPYPGTKKKFAFELLFLFFISWNSMIF